MFSLKAVDSPNIPLLPITTWEAAPQQRHELPHLERVHILYNIRDLQRATCILSEVEEQNDLVGKRATLECDGSIYLSGWCRMSP